MRAMPSPMWWASTVSAGCSRRKRATLAWWAPSEPVSCRAYHDTSNSSQPMIVPASTVAITTRWARPQRGSMQPSSATAKQITMMRFPVLPCHMRDWGGSGVSRIPAQRSLWEALNGQPAVRCRLPRHRGSSRHRTPSDSGEREEQLLQLRLVHCGNCPAFALRHALLEPAGDQLESRSVESARHRRQLGDDIGAIAAILEHADDPADLAFGSPKPLEHIDDGGLVKLHDDLLPRGAIRWGVPGSERDKIM